MSEVRYTRSLDTTGWLLVQLEPSRSRVVVCEYTKVMIQKKTGGRTYFKILEGRYANQNASLSDVNVPKCLVTANRGTGATLNVKILGRKKEFSPIKGYEYNQLFAELTFSGKKARITLDSDVDYTETDTNNPLYNKVRHSKPLPKGTYNILIPTYPISTDYTSGYRTHSNGFKDLKYDGVWFPVEYAPNYNSNFVHIGNVSHGCVTCYEIQKWNELYDYLIKHRTADGKYIGKLIIS